MRITLSVIPARKEEAAAAMVARAAILSRSAQWTNYVAALRVMVERTIREVRSVAPVVGTLTMTLVTYQEGGHLDQAFGLRTCHQAWGKLISFSNDSRTCDPAAFAPACILSSCTAWVTLPKQRTHAYSCIRRWACLSLIIGIHAFFDNAVTYIRRSRVDSGICFRLRRGSQLLWTAEG